MVKRVREGVVNANGLKFLWEEIPTVKSVTVGIWFRAGVVNESQRINGISHLIEHLLFQGTTNRSSLDISHEIDGVGGVLDAFTDNENTTYVARVLDEHLELALDLLSDMTIRPALTPKTIEKEKRVVLEEIRMYEDTPAEKIHDLLMYNLLPKHPLAMPVLGYADTVSALNGDDFTNYRKSRYTANNAVIAAAGNIDGAQLTALIEKYFEPLSATGNDCNGFNPDETYPTPAAIEKDTEQVHICLGYPGVPYHSPDRFAMAILSALLGGTMSSRLFRKIRDEYGLAYAVYSYSRGYKDTGISTVYVGTAPETAMQARDLALEEIAKIIKDGPTDAEVVRTKETLKGNIMLALEGTSARMNRLAHHELYLGKHHTLEETIANIERVTRNEVHTIAKQVFGTPPKIVAIGPDAESLI